jgi:hypothetical protein
MSLLQWSIGPKAYLISVHFAFGFGLATECCCFEALDFLEALMPSSRWPPADRRAVHSLGRGFFLKKTPLGGKYEKKSKKKFVKKR